MTDSPETKSDPLHNPAVWFSALLLVFPLLLLIDLFYVHPASYDGNLRTQIVTGVLAVIMMVGGYWLGTVANGAQKKSEQPPETPPVAPGQGGFHTLRFVLLLAFLAITAAALSACASLTDAGHASYTFEPVVGADGKATGGCKFSATDGKEFSGRSIAATSTADGCQVVVQEGASTAFQGQAIAGKALSVLPSFAPILLPPGPATVVPQLRAQPAPAAPVPASPPL